jgi:flagellar biosynthesis protein FlhF
MDAKKFPEMNGCYAERRAFRDASPARGLEVKTFRAATMYEALALVRRELGADAAVLHTREVRRRRLFGWVPGSLEIEITASQGVNVPSRLPPSRRVAAAEPVPAPSMRLDIPAARFAAAPISALPAPLPGEVQTQLSQLQAMVKQLCQRPAGGGRQDLPEELFRLFTDLLDCELSEELARELIDQLRRAGGEQLGDRAAAKGRIVKMIESQVVVSGPIQVTPGRRRLAALVGPTGVGKTTTIAKLAAHYRLKEKRRVGLITVDTYRIGAVEQLRTYADIIDLPMLVVSTPREMREAVGRMDGLDLILMDTAGRSPRDEVRIQELRAFLTEAEADEVHLVLSAVTGGRGLEQTAERFAGVGTTALLLTKLDEATGLGNILPVLRSSKLPLSYLTDGQNVPDDIEIAAAGRVARLIMREEQTRRSNHKND